MMKAPIRIVAALVVLSGLAGCRTFSHSCIEPTYGSGETLPPLQVPAGLAAPDTRNALKIPPLNEPQRQRGASEPCLEEPPAYAPGVNLDHKPAKR